MGLIMSEQFKTFLIALATGLAVALIG